MRTPTPTIYWIFRLRFTGNTASYFYCQLRDLSSIQQQKLDSHFAFLLLSEDRECMEGWCGGLVAKDGHQGSYVAPMEPIWRYARTECKECLECVAGNIQCLECRGWVAIYQLSQGWARPERQKDVAPARVALYQQCWLHLFKEYPLRFPKI